MSLPLQYAHAVVQSMRVGTIRNLVAQAKAKQVLREVRELPANFPQFTPDLDERVTFVAYSLLAAGCSMIEQGELDDGCSELQSSADLLESAHRTEARTDRASGFHSLIGAMAFYACGQYSRAFVLVKDVETVTPAAGVIASFLRKDSQQLIERLNAVLLGPQPELDDSGRFDEWVMGTAIGRGVALALEYSFSGEPGLLDEAASVLNDAMIIGENVSQPAFWWLARLLKLMLNDHGASSLWRVIPPFFGPDGASRVGNYVRLLAFSKPPVTELWRSQIASLKIALNQHNSGGVINLRTSAGKTRVAELAILQTLLCDPGAKVLFLAPFRSLAFELERALSRTLSPLGYSVSHLYGGSRFSAVDRELAIEANITIATPEKAKAMLRAAPELFEDVKLIVVDEGHLLGDNARNVRNELFLDHLRLLARKRGARMLLLSAVLPNAEELALWIGGDESALAKSNWKPSGERFGLLRWMGSGVKIEWLGDQSCFNPHFIEFKEIPKGKKTTRQFPNTKPEAVAATAVRLAEFGPVLIFAGQAQWVDSMAKGVLVALGSNSPPHPWPETEWNIFEAVCREELGPNCLELQAARVGVVCHSNKLPPQVRICVEKLIAKHPPRIIVATTTLGQGVNIGISSVIVSTPFIGAQLRISQRDFWNICGRAGRAFVDGEGKVLFAIDCTRSAGQVRQDERIAKSYLDISRLDPVESGLLQLVRTLRSRATLAGVSFDVLLELVANSDFDRCGEQKETVQRLLDWIDDQLLALHIEYKGSDDSSESTDWVDDAFRESLAAIQERKQLSPRHEPELLRFLKARTSGVLRQVPSSSARRAVVASGLPLSVGVVAFDQLDAFRQMVDRYLVADGNDNALGDLVRAFELWAHEHAGAIMDGMPLNQATLEPIRTLWLGGVSMHSIVEQFGEGSAEVCTDFYGYQLPWLFHSIAQKLDKIQEENRVVALALVGLLVELGLPSEAAAKVFLTGVRSRSAAVELSRFVRDSSVSIRQIRSGLLEVSTVEAMARSGVSPSTLEWLNLLSSEHGTSQVEPPRCVSFRVAAPEGVNLLHVRRLGVQGSAYLCSSDAKFKCAVGSTDVMPFEKLANDSRFVFIRDGDAWRQQCRDPRVSPVVGSFDASNF
jgi:hypothetical protein